MSRTNGGPHHPDFDTDIRVGDVVEVVDVDPVTNHPCHVGSKATVLAVAPPAEDGFRWATSKGGSLRGRFRVLEREGKAYVRGAPTVPELIRKADRQMKERAGGRGLLTLDTLKRLLRQECTSFGCRVEEWPDGGIWRSNRRESGIADGYEARVVHSASGREGVVCADAGSSRSEEAWSQACWDALVGITRRDTIPVPAPDPEAAGLVRWNQATIKALLEIHPGADLDNLAAETGMRKRYPGETDESYRAHLIGTPVLPPGVELKTVEWFPIATQAPDPPDEGEEALRCCWCSAPLENGEAALLHKRCERYHAALQERLAVGGASDCEFERDRVREFVVRRWAENQVHALSCERCGCPNASSELCADCERTEAKVEHSERLRNWVATCEQRARVAATELARFEARNAEADPISEWGAGETPNWSWP